MSDNEEMIRWDEMYKSQAVETMPWYNPHLDDDIVEALGVHGIHEGKVLDLGTGPGTQALALAKLGFTVVATDISETAAKQAAEMAKKAGLDVKFRQDNILETGISEIFDLVVDRGCFHVIQPDLRRIYVDNVANILDADGYLFLKTFSHKEPGPGGPFRFRPEELQDIFAPKFIIISAKESVFTGNLNPSPIANFLVLQKI